MQYSMSIIMYTSFQGSGVGASQVILGMVFKKEVEGSMRKMEGAKVAVFTCPFDLTLTETKVHFHLMFQFHDIKLIYFPIRVRF